jgi:hypothetical protein
LAVSLKGLTERIRDTRVSTPSLKRTEDAIRAQPMFGFYEDLKTRFLKDWLRRFAAVSEAELAGMSPAEVQRLIQEHQRHQVTQLLKGKVQPVDLDMSEHLGMHDTLESEFRDREFWQPANAAVKTGFVRWIMDVVQAFGMLNGRRHALFKSLVCPEQYLLFGLALSHLPEEDERPIRMMPYLKPFARKGTYLLEIRKRDIGDQEAYHHELRHYTLPFVFAFDQMRQFNLRRELVSFFTSTY